MLSKQFHITLVISLISFICYSQKADDNSKVETDLLVVQDSVVRPPIDALSPSRAAFYSAVLPGLGQAYNKKYWKIPLVYAAIGIPVYFYIDNNKEYKRYRNAYKRRLAGFTDDEFYGTDLNGNPLATPRVSDDGLIHAQETLRRNKELSLLIAIGAYALNVIDANVDAHLLQYNVDENLAIKPHFKYDEQENATNLGLTLNFNF